VSLSPIYDSISKQGYRAAFTREELLKAAQDGIIDNKVYALGGVTFSRLEEVKALGFGGAMILGDAWRPQSKA
jgi:thiamine-phosphate pyrophosphorylase